MRIRQSVPAVHPTERMHTMLARLYNIIGACGSTCWVPDSIVRWTRGDFIQRTVPHRLSLIRNERSFKRRIHSPPSAGQSHLPPVSPLRDPRPSNNSAISSCQHSSKMRHQNLPPEHHHRGCSAHDCPQRQNRGCRQQAHHRGCCVPSHVIILHRPCTIQLGLPPLQMIPQHRPTYDWCDPSINDAHEVTTRLPSWTTAIQTMKTKTLQNVAVQLSGPSSDECSNLHGTRYASNLSPALLHTKSTISGPPTSPQTFRHLESCTLLNNSQLHSPRQRRPNESSDLPCRQLPQPLFRPNS